MNILITVACGFIGTNLCQSLLHDGYFVTRIYEFKDDYDRSINRKNQRDLEQYEKFNLIECDLLSVDLTRLADGVDVIFH